jgi:hypothetical protein
MKRMIFLAFMYSLLSGITSVKSRDIPFRKDVDYIDSLLSKNPYAENFLGITYYYSLNITPERELIIKMDFNGPFSTTFKASHTALKINPVVDTTEYTSSMCWKCKPDDSGTEKRCITQENNYTTGEKDIVDSEDICIMLPTQSNIRIKLIEAIDVLVRKASE